MRTLKWILVTTGICVAVYRIITHCKTSHCRRKWDLMDFDLACYTIDIQDEEFF